MGRLSRISCLRVCRWRAGEKEVSLGETKREDFMRRANRMNRRGSKDQDTYVLKFLTPRFSPSVEGERKREKERVTEVRKRFMLEAQTQ